jgi:hypothetical protein
MLVRYNSNKVKELCGLGQEHKYLGRWIGNQLKVTGHLFTAAHIVQDQLHHSLSLKPIYDAQKTQVESDGVTAAS